MPRSWLLLSAFLLPAFPAHAAEIGYGSSAPHICYLAADAHRRDADSRKTCSDAIVDINISNHDHVASLVNRGIVEQLAGDRARAIADYDGAIVFDADEPEAYLNKGLAVLDLADPSTAAAAIPLFEQALAKRTVRPEIAYYGRAMAYELSGRLRAAYNDYRHALAIAPTFAPAREQLSRFRVTS